jgi:hypothetical protein
VPRHVSNMRTSCALNGLSCFIHVPLMASICPSCVHHVSVMCPHHVFIMCRHVFIMCRHVFIMCRHVFSCASTKSLTPSSFSQGYHDVSNHLQTARRHIFPLIPHDVSLPGPITILYFIGAKVSPSFLKTLRWSGSHFLIVVPWLMRNSFKVDIIMRT